ncbi:MAG: hypothetical protein A2287_06245 [Candidatus Melainabacteria bacterium RIFOXYA12_FULL_32_12]|nr:MAG: hypothetical protein A2255_01240 [Candidatus Melainabacteria bacterium RIFOXYA2_FULL_32_9]OGI31021.1 MAG: hypothetical protein A2287_06245 [Candidatus Melainabacteria bacterium RIFOXYA12_FULL_32_12]
MIFRSIFLIILCLITGCGFTGSAISQTHSANQYFKALEYPRIGLNQLSTKRIRNNPSAIQDAAMLDMVIINKSEDLFVDQEASYEIARKLKAINPNIKVLQYLTISDVWYYQDTYKNFAKQHPNILLKDRQGNYIHPYSSSYGKKRYMFDSTEPIWQNYFAARMKKITDQGMDGLFIDNLWRSNWQNLKISEERFKQIQRGWETALQKGRQLIGPSKIILANSPPYALYQTRDIVMLEGRLKPTKKSLDEYFKWTDQAQSYNQLIYDAVQYDAYKGDKFHYVPEFFLPAVLLTDNIWGVSYESPKWFELVRKVGKIGYPTASRQRSPNGVLVRDYTKGKVLLNDTNTAKIVTLPQNVYMTIDKVSINQVTLQPMKGIVLKKR